MDTGFFEFIPDYNSHQFFVMNDIFYHR
jgi:hypothetical protein